MTADHNYPIKGMYVLTMNGGIIGARGPEFCSSKYNLKFCVANAFLAESWMKLSSTYVCYIVLT